MANAGDWFEIPVGDLARAVKFYTHVFGIEMHEMTMGPARMAMFPVDPSAPGAGGALIQSEGYSPSHAGSLIYLAVDDIDATLRRVRDAGGSILVQKMDIGEYGCIAHFQDSEGNRVALHSA